MARVLVVDGQHRSALAVVRSLGRAGHTCIVTAPELPAIAAVSRYCNEVHTLEFGYCAVAATRLRALIDMQGIDIVVPISDKAMTCVLRDFPEGSIGRSKVAAPTPAAYKALSDKSQLLIHAESLGFAIPNSVVVNEPGDGLFQAAETVGYPCVIKPHRSVVLIGGRPQRLFVKFATTPADLAEATASLPEEAFPVLVQERIIGRGEGVFLLSDGQNIRASFAHTRLREYPPSGGASTYRESIEVPPNLLSLSLRLLQSVCWEGVAMVEFKRSAASGEPYLMEVNGRFWGSLQLAVDAGVDFPRMLIDMLLKRPFMGTPSYRVGVRTRWFWGDFEYLWTRLRRQRQNLHLPADEKGRGRWNILRDVLRVRRGERIEELQMSDPMPFFFELRRRAQRLRKKMFGAKL
ncbi:MAG: ATP-grasp domain-containing protein [Woeseia sp.]